MENILKIPTTLQTAIRQLPLDSRFKDSLSLAQYGPDIWFTDQEIAKHCDNTDPGKDSIFCVLVNDANYKFIRYAAKKEIYNLPVGIVIRHNGHILHQVTKGKKSGRFAVLIWDVPIDKHTDKLAIEIQNVLNSANKRTLTEITFTK